MGLQQRFPALLRAEPSRSTASRPDPTAIVLGKDTSGFPVSLPLRPRQEHVFILGSTGSGKSRLLLHYMRQIVKRGEGGLFLDPHGAHQDSDYRNLLVWLVGRDKRVHVIDLNAPRVIGFNPLACPAGTDPSVIAGNVMDALAITWEGESFSQRPSIERVLGAALIALVELKLTLCEAPQLLDRTDRGGLRRHAIQNVKDEHTREELKRLHELSQDGRRKRDYDQEIVGPLNRFARLLRPVVIRTMLGQRDGLDLRAAMDSGDVVLANLSGGEQVYKRDTDLVGRLLTRTALFEAERRSNTRPFSLILDEAHRFLSSDIPVLLAEVRKYGISVVAAMQWLEQARTQDENILAALLNVNCKICFRLRDAEEAETLARSIVPLNLERPVSALIKPTVIGHRRIHLANQSEGESDSRTKGTTYGETRSHAVTQAETVAYTHAEYQGTAQAQGETAVASHSEADTSGNSESASEILIPVEGNDPIVSRMTAGTAVSIASITGHSKGSATSKSKVTSSGTLDSVSHAYSTAVTDGLATSLAESEARTVGTNKTRGESEALEPILDNLPSAVHSIQNELYAAGLLLRNLPTAVGFVNYVGRRGPVSTLFTVPPILSGEVSDEKFFELRDRFLPPLSVAAEPVHEPADVAGAQSQSNDNSDGSPTW